MAKDKIPRNLSEGCKLCYQGAKLVLFISGLCDRTCWYCPLSEERKDVDVIFANDQKITTPKEAIEEAEIMDALGTGVTGGEPLLVIERVVEFCTALKKHFGEDHHIHLYTGRAPTEEDLAVLKPCVDEIRMHPPHEEWAGIMESDYPKSIAAAKRMGFDVGIEVPSLQGLRHFFPLFDSLDFFNINQLEWGDACAEAMRLRKLEPINPLCNAIKGSTKWAGEVNGHPKVHYCTSTFKDSVQLRERLKRIARNSARPFDMITDDGTIMYGVMDPLDDLEMILSQMRPGSYYEEMPDGTIELDWQQMRKIPRKFGGERKIIERYPNDGMIVEVIPL
ncbi:MAG TPA: 4Fe-4S cluster-binding domain-containing protein [Methanocorpusculum sp.]|nr:4Fe-4S cluster-binding domain-containing protein [Methanocorpusculum sp.]